MRLLLGSRQTKFLCGLGALEVRADGVHQPHVRGHHRTTWQETFKENPRDEAIAGVFKLIDKPSALVTDIWAAANKVMIGLNAETGPIRGLGTADLFLAPAAVSASTWPVTLLWRLCGAVLAWAVSASA